MKKCSICGTKNCDESNFCIHCGNIINSEIYCPNCGGINNPFDVFCQHCSKQISPTIIDGFDVLFNDFNKESLKNYELTSLKYEKLLYTVFSKARGKRISEISLKNKIKRICEVFAVCLPKSNSNYDYGYNFINRIYYDDMTTTAEQIGAMIHELAHVLLFEFILAIVCDIFHSERNSTLESFVYIFVSNSSIMPTINEYYASTVESRFIHFDYRNYNSYLECKNKLPQQDLIKPIIKIANCLSNDVIGYLEYLIREDLRSDIKLRYVMDNVKSKDCPVVNDVNNRYSIDKTCNELMKLINKFYKEASTRKYIKKLENVKNTIEHGYKI